MAAEGPSQSSSYESPSASPPDSGWQATASRGPDQSAATSAPPKLNLRTLADGPIDDDRSDRLGFKALADGLALLMESEQTGTPLTIALSAPWGAGKTSLLRLVQRRLQAHRPDRPPNIVVWFNAWMHDEAPSLSAALAADIARHATRYRDPWTRLRHPLPTSMLSPKEKARRRFWLILASVAIAGALYPLVSVIIGPGAGNVTKVRAAFGASAVGWFALLWVVSAILPRVNRSVAAVAAFVDSPRSAAATGSMSEVKEQLGELIAEARAGCRRAWRTRAMPRFVVIVDDLERCEPPKAVDMCEVAAQLLAHEGVVIVLVGDLRVIGASAEMKYKEAAARLTGDPNAAYEGWSNYGRFFLEKVVQFELELPPLAAGRVRALATSAAISAADADDASDEVHLPSVVSRLIASWQTAAMFVLVVGEPLLVSLLVVYTTLPFAAILGISLAPVAAVALAAAALRRLGKGLRREAKWDAYVRSVVDDELARLAHADDIPTADALLQSVRERVETNTRDVVRRNYRRFGLPPTHAIDAQLKAFVAESSPIRRDAEASVVGYLPTLPRTAKRLLNRLSFLLVVATDRELLGEGGVSPQQLGKWAAILDRWPEAARVITYRPTLLGELERAAHDEASFAELCAAQRPPLVDAVAAGRKLMRAEPSLADSACTLVYLDLLKDLSLAEHIY